MGDIQRRNDPVCAEADAVVDAKVVAFARDDHVIVAVIPHFAGAPRPRGGDGAGNGKRVALTFLATEAAPHPAGLDAHGMHGFAQGFGHFMLDLGGVLG